MNVVTGAASPRRRYRGWTLVAAPVAALVIGVGLSSCGGSKSSSDVGATGMSTSAMASMPGGTSGSMVDVKNFSFAPMNLSVAVGTTVTWKFDDTAQHTVKASDGSFTSPALSGGKTYQYTFSKAGRYPYICSIHQYMTGTITVK